MFLWQLSANASDQGDLSKNNDESEEIMHESNISSDSDLNEENDAPNDDSN